MAKKTLTVTGLTANDKTYDGTTAATVSGTFVLNGVVGTDDVTLGGTPIHTFATSNAGSGITVTTSGYTLNGTTAGNYIVTQPSFTANILKANQTITFGTIADKLAGFAVCFKWNDHFRFGYYIYQF